MKFNLFGKKRCEIKGHKPIRINEDYLFDPHYKKFGFHAIGSVAVEAICEIIKCKRCGLTTLPFNIKPYDSVQSLTMDNDKHKELRRRGYTSNF